jgi:dihydrofolate reductase
MNCVSEKLCDELLAAVDMRAIAAVAENSVIGNNGALPWKIPEELAFFRRTTENASVLMGRKTFEFIGHPLPNRRNIVLSRNPSWQHSGVTAIIDFRQLLDMEINGTLWLCGGSAVYAALLSACRELYISKVVGNFPGDAKFPAFDNLFAMDSVVMAHPMFRTERHVNIKFLKMKNAHD